MELGARHRSPVRDNIYVDPVEEEDDFRQRRSSLRRRLACRLFSLFLSTCFMLIIFGVTSSLLFIYFPTWWYAILGFAVLFLLDLVISLFLSVRVVRTYRRASGDLYDVFAGDTSTPLFPEPNSNLVLRPSVRHLYTDEHGFSLAKRIPTTWTPDSTQSTPRPSLHHSPSSASSLSSSSPDSPPRQTQPTHVTIVKTPITQIELDDVDFEEESDGEGEVAVIVEESASSSGLASNEFDEEEEEEEESDV